MISSKKNSSSMTKMLKFMRHQSKVVSPERLQKQKELFGFTESCYHGFPAKPSALAWDPKLHLIALGTRNGHIRIYGDVGVEIYSQQDNEAAIIKLCFLPGQGLIVSLCEDNSLHLWKIQEDSGKKRSVLVRTKSTSLEGKLKKISVIVEDTLCKNLLVGTEGGNIYVLDLANFTMTNDIIYQDVVMQNVPEDYKVNPGPVEVLVPHPLESSKILIGYQRGLIVLWDKKQLCAEQTYISSQQLESLCWNADATEFISSHNDGSFMVWSVDEARGMPRANYGDRFTVTAMQDDNHVTFNLTSRVIDFLVTEDEEKGDVSTLVVLAEEEIVFIDLATEGWPVFKNPYLATLHSSAITCSSYISKVDTEIFEKIMAAGDSQKNGYSDRGWTINGGTAPKLSPTQNDILLTGHEDGTVRFWDASGLCLKLLYKFSTASLFVSDDLGGDLGNDDDEDWPPFRKTGLFDPYSDDPRLGIKKLEMCPHTGQLVVAGTAGQIIVYEINLDEKSSVVQCVEVNVVAETDNFVWKSHSRLDMQKDSIKFSSGMQPMVVVQFYPPASCTSLNLHSEWGLIAAGTAHGFALFDYIVKKNLLAKSTLSAMDLANAADEGPMSRRKSLKKSLRESFRRLRRGKSQKKANITKAKDENTSAPHPQNRSAHQPEEEAVKPVERAVEARTQSPDYIGSMVRCLHLTKCYIASSQLMSATLWAGTNSGAVFIFTIAIPPSEKRLEVPLTVQLGKEIHLKHGAPVINTLILDGASIPFPNPMAVKRGASSAPDTSGPHRVLITSEEQFKVFTLPHLKPYCKFKLTAQEGSRVRKVGVSEFASTADKTYKESCVMVVTNQGDLSVYSLPDCRKQVMAQVIKREDISGINSVVFTKRGEALYLVSASELARISLSAQNVTLPQGKVKIASQKKAPSPIKKEVNASPKKAENIPVPEEEAVSEKSPSKEATPATPSAKKPEEIMSVKKPEELKENGDSSLLSGDITIDSIRDHMDEVKTSEKVVELATSSSVVTSLAETESTSGSTAFTTTTVSTIKEESSMKTEGNLTVVKTSNVTITSSQETTSVQVVETSQNEENLAINGTETFVASSVLLHSKEDGLVHRSAT
ncbi:Lethal(2) giant larvae-like protein 2 [Armadillidium nasatum]|uniref:Lethal(2) giant larvae-like protein 2 n=1 Tax=Armadillidium nasatum TaxID=96803 RepID=A0A5N5T1P0_9CRUS|nr:Lethal(2) giant larvae-like protein 2 [Armadillidium nasatum]